MLASLCMRCSKHPPAVHQPCCTHTTCIHSEVRCAGLNSHGTFKCVPHIHLVSLYCAEAPQLEPPSADGGDSRQSAGPPGDCEAAPKSAWCSWAMHIPKWMWRRIVVRMPVSSKVQLAGVNVSLQEYARAHRNRQITSGTSDARLPVSPNAARQAGVSFQPDSIHTHQGQHQTHGHSNPQAQSKTPVTETATVKPVEQPERIVATYTLLRQWGAEVMVTIQPPGWTKAASTDHQGAEPHVHAPGQPFQLRTKALNRLHSIWESQEGSADEESPGSASGVQSLFSSQTNGHPGHAQATPGSPGLLFTIRQTNPLCKHMLALSASGP